jgi:hypothetical protein
MKNQSIIGDLHEIRGGELLEVLNFGSAMRIVNIIMVSCVESENARMVCQMMQAISIKR